MSRSVMEAWEQAATDPDPNADLGYSLQPLTVIRVEEGDKKFMVLPGEEDHLKDDEYIVASPGSICRLDECR